MQVLTQHMDVSPKMRQHRVSAVKVHMCIDSMQARTKSVQGCTDSMLLVLSQCIWHFDE